MQSNRKISIILPTYNGADRISKSIESIINQTYNNWELIIVNDCSTDNTLSVITDYSLIDNRIRIINNKTNQKLPKSLNIGFNNASGDLFTWTSDDNSYHSDALAVMESALTQSDADFVYSDYNIVNMNGDILWSEINKDPKYLIYENTVGACFLYKKIIAEQIGKYDINLFLAEDYEYWIRAFLQGKMVHVSENLYDYGIHENSLTSTRKIEIKKATFLAKNKHFEELYDMCNTRKERNLFLWKMLEYVPTLSEYKAIKKEYYQLNKCFAISDICKCSIRKIKNGLYKIFKI